MEASNPVYLQHTVRRLIWVTAIFAAFISIIAISGLSVAWYSLHQQVERNEDTIAALCREVNEHNRTISTILRDAGIPRHLLAPLAPRPCNVRELRGD